MIACISTSYRMSRSMVSQTLEEFTDYLFPALGLPQPHPSLVEVVAPIKGQKCFACSIGTAKFMKADPYCHQDTGCFKGVTIRRGRIS